jgi:cell division protein FtsB
MQTLWVAPFISADESLVRCRQGAEEIEALIRENDALKRENADLREDLSIAKVGPPLPRSIVRGRL